jgi:hypothetical protein
MGKAQDCEESGSRGRELAGFSDCARERYEKPSSAVKQLKGSQWVDVWTRVYKTPGAIGVILVFRNVSEISSVLGIAVLI